MNYDVMKLSPSASEISRLQGARRLGWGDQPLAELGTRTSTSDPASTPDQSPSNSSWASAAARKRPSIALTASGAEVDGSVSSYTTPGAPGACPTSKATWQSSGSSRTALINVSVPAL